MLKYVVVLITMPKTTIGLGNCDMILGENCITFWISPWSSFCFCLKPRTSSAHIDFTLHDVSPLAMILGSEFSSSILTHWPLLVIDSHFKWIAFCWFVQLRFKQQFAPDRVHCRMLLPVFMSIWYLQISAAMKAEESNYRETTTELIGKRTDHFFPFSRSVSDSISLQIVFMPLYIWLHCSIFFFRTHQCSLSIVKWLWLPNGYSMKHHNIGPILGVHDDTGKNVICYLYHEQAKMCLKMFLKTRETLYNSYLDLFK